MCQQNTTGIFPSCEPCDECTGQWTRRIDQLEENVGTTISFIATLNLTNVTVDGEDIPTLDILFDLLQQIRAVLNTSQIDFISNVVQSNHTRICTLINQTQLLINRAILVQNRLDSLENTSESIRAEVVNLIEILAALQNEFENISQLTNFTSVDPSFYLSLAQAALERSNRADQLINTNVTMLIADTRSLVANFSTKREESRFVEQRQNNTETLSMLRRRLDAFENLIMEANRRLCGAGVNDTCVDECGGVSCDVCGGEGCESLVSDASEAANVSRRALAIVEDKLQEIRSQVDALDEILRDAEMVRNDSTRAEQFTEETSTKAEELLSEVRDLISKIEVELNQTRVDPDRIGRLENMTLALVLDVEMVRVLTITDVKICSLPFSSLTPPSLFLSHSSLPFPSLTPPFLFPLSLLSLFPLSLLPSFFSLTPPFLFLSHSSLSHSFLSSLSFITFPPPLTPTPSPLSLTYPSLSLHSLPFLSFLLPPFLLPSFQTSW